LCLGYFAAASYSRVEIQSCSACKLNRLPAVKKFIKEKGQADSYENMKINYIPGHNPDLVLFDSQNNEVERIDMSNYNTEQLHELVQSKGFNRQAPEL